MKDMTNLPSDEAIAVVVRAIHAHQSAVRVANGEQPFHPFDQNPPKELAKWAEEARVALHAYLTQTDEGRALVRDAARWRILDDNNLRVIECLQERWGYRSTANDARRERWTELDGYILSNDISNQQPYRTMADAVDAAIARQEKKS